MSCADPEKKSSGKEREQEKILFAERVFRSAHGIIFIPSMCFFISFKSFIEFKDNRKGCER